MGGDTKEAATQRRRHGDRSAAYRMDEEEEEAEEVRSWWESHQSRVKALSTEGVTPGAHKEVAQADFRRPSPPPVTPMTPPPPPTDIPSATARSGHGEIPGRNPEKSVS